MTVKIVKSVARVLEILELYNEVQEPLAAVDVADRLNYPLASTHEILKTMVELGYFTYGNPKWTYKPSSRFPEIVAWVKSSVSNDSNIFMLMEALNNETRETINLSRLVSTQAKIIKGLECKYEIGVSSKPGTLMDATLSLTGIVALSFLADDELQDFFTSLQKTNPLVSKNTDFNLIQSIHEELETSGYSMRTDVNINGIGAVCCPVLASDNEHYVLGIVGPSHRISENKDNLVRSLKTYARRYSVQSKFPIKS